MLPKVPIILKNALIKSCPKLYFLQKPVPLRLQLQFFPQLSADDSAANDDFFFLHHVHAVIFPHVSAYDSE